MLEDLNFASEVIDIEEDENNDHFNAQRFTALLLWYEVITCARSRGSNGAGQNYFLKNPDTNLVKILKTNPGIIGEVRSLNLERNIRLISKPADDPIRPDEERIVFHRCETGAPECVRVRPNTELYNNKIISYAFYGTALELKRALSGLFEDLDRITFTCKNDEFGTLITAVSKIDRTTIRDRTLIVKELFGIRADKMPDIGTILQAANPKNQKAALVELEAAGPYQNGGFICRTIGNRTVRFNIEAYLSDIRERKLLEGITISEADRSKLVERGLQCLRLNITFNKLLHIILHEAYCQNMFHGRGIYLRKKNLMSLMGYHSKDTSKYREIRDALDAMRYFEYKIYKEDSNGGVREREAGYFLTRLVDEPRAYIVDVNTAAVGCVTSLGKGRLQGGEFDRGYYQWTPIIIYASRHFSRAGYLLAQLLVSETGNVALKAPGLKVIAYNLGTLYAKLQIAFGRPRQCYRALVEAIKETINCGLLYSVDPSLPDLIKLRRKQLQNRTIKFSVCKDLKDVITEMTSRLEVEF